LLRDPLRVEPALAVYAFIVLFWLFLVRRLGVVYFKNAIDLVVIVGKLNALYFGLKVGSLAKPFLFHEGIQSRCFGHHRLGLDLKLAVTIEIVEVFISRLIAAVILFVWLFGWL
jgi:hypothetical protein